MNELRTPVRERAKTPPPYIPKESPKMKKVSRFYNIKALVEKTKKVAAEKKVKNGTR